MTQDELFNVIKKDHPEWSDEQVWTQVSVHISGEKVISQNPNNNENDSLIVRSIIEMANNWLRDNLPYIWEKAKDWFAGILNRIIDWFKERGWDFLMDVFAN